MLVYWIHERVEESQRDRSRRLHQVSLSCQRDYREVLSLKKHHLLALTVFRIPCKSFRMTRENDRNEINRTMVMSPATDNLLARQNSETNDRN